MYSSFTNSFSTVEEILSMSIEDLAFMLLKHLSGYGDDGFNRHNFGQKDTVQSVPKEQRLNVMRAFMEAWGWLEKEVLITKVPAMESSMDFYFITRHGKEVLANGKMC